MNRPASTPAETPPNTPLRTPPGEERPLGPRRARLHRIVFEDDTFAGRAFDIALIMSVVASIIVVSVETMNGLSVRAEGALHTAEWMFTVLFTIEYAVRLLAVRRPVAYVTSFFGVVDLLAVLPTWLSIFIPGAQAFLVIRVLRLLRIFRVLKLSRFLTEADTLRSALQASARKIAVFLMSVGTVVVIVGTLMFIIEGAEHGFTSIPVSMYWAVVTLTTVGYGDIAPRTPVGQILASLLMILGYGVIAVPTGIVSTHLAADVMREKRSASLCPHCGFTEHDDDALFCKRCGDRLTRPTADTSGAKPLQNS